MPGFALTDPDGFELTDAQGRALEVECGSVEGCCGACTRVYRFLACCSTAPVLEVLVCADAKCGETPIAEIFRIVVGTMCYSRGENSASEPVTAGMTLTDGADIDACDHGGCTSPECVDYCGNRFIPGTPCNSAYGGPPAYVPAIAGIICGTLGIGNPRVCFKFDPANTVPESQVPPGAIIMDPEGLKPENNPARDCCFCEPGCIGTIQTVTECSGSGSVEVERRCCCTPRRDVTITISSVTEYNPAISFVLKREITGTILRQYDDAGTLINQVPATPVYRVKETNVDGSVTEFDQSWSVPEFTTICLPLPPEPYPGPYKPFDWVTECGYLSDGSDGNTGRALTNVVRLCGRGAQDGSWSLKRNAGIAGDPLSGQTLFQGTFTASATITFFGPCAGGCGEAQGRSAVIAARGTAGQWSNGQIANGKGPNGGGCAGCGGDKLVEI